MKLTIFEYYIVMLKICSAQKDFMRESYLSTHKTIYYFGWKKK